MLISELANKPSAIKDLLPIVELECDWCNATFDRRRCRIKQSIKRGGLYGFCSPKCCSKHTLTKHYKEKPKVVRVVWSELLNNPDTLPQAWGGYSIGLTCDHCNAIFVISRSVAQQKLIKQVKKVYCNRDCFLEAKQVIALPRRPIECPTIIWKSFRAYQYDAWKRNYAWELTLEDFTTLIKDSCHYCHGEGGGIDRVANTIGYTVENCVSCCSVCNRMKSDMNYTDFVSLCNRIATAHPIQSMCTS